MHRSICKYVFTRNEIFPTSSTLYALTGSEAEGSVGFGPRITARQIKLSLPTSH